MSFRHFLDSASKMANQFQAMLSHEFITANRNELDAEELECVKKWLDEQNVKRRGALPDGSLCNLSVIGRIECYGMRKFWIGLIGGIIGGLIAKLLPSLY